MNSWSNFFIFQGIRGIKLVKKYCMQNVWAAYVHCISICNSGIVLHRGVLPFSSALLPVRSNCRPLPYFPTDHPWPLLPCTYKQEELERLLGQQKTPSAYMKESDKYQYLCFYFSFETHLMSKILHCTFYCNWQLQISFLIAVRHGKISGLHDS